jgi:hypothetical protein
MLSAIFLSDGSVAPITNTELEGHVPSGAGRIPTADQPLKRDHCAGERRKVAKLRTAIEDPDGSYRFQYSTESFQATR